METRVNDQDNKVEIIANDLFCKLSMVWKDSTTAVNLSEKESIILNCSIHRLEKDCLKKGIRDSDLRKLMLTNIAEK